mgnify:CR=1 FL=1
MTEDGASEPNWRVHQVLLTEEAIYGLILVSGMIVVSGQSGTASIEVLVTVIVTVAVMSKSPKPWPASSRTMASSSRTMAWWSVCSAMFYLVVSATLALAYGSVNAIIGLVLSVIAYAAVNAVLVRHAIRTGLSVSLFSRILLGRTGAAIATLPEDGGLVFSTNPPGGIDVGRNGLFVRANADVVYVAFRDTVASVAPRAAVDSGACSQIHVWANVGAVGGVWLALLIGIALSVSFLGMFVQLVHLNILRREDLVWTAQIGDVIAGHEERLPELGKYNFGQKSVFWGMFWLILALLITGVMMWYQYFPHLVSIETRRIAIFVHSVSAVLIVLVFILHIFAALWTRGTLRAMTRGTVTGGWSWRHHRKWLRELARRQRTKPAE